MMSLYKKEKINPLSSCLPLLIQLPFLFAIFQVLRDGFKNGSFDKLYPFISAPEQINTVFLGIINLENPNIALAVVAGALQFAQTKMLVRTKQPTVPGSKDENMAAIMNKQMLYIAPILTVLFGASLPGGLTLYWTANTLATLLQQIFVFKKENKDAQVIN